MSDPVVLQPGESWLLEQWLEKFGKVLESMVDERPSLTWTTEDTGEIEPGALLIEQKFSPSPEPLLWMGVPEETWQDIGKRVLQAAGVDAVSDEERRNTCLEILQQTGGALARALGDRLHRDITPSEARQPSFFPRGLPTVRISVKYGDTVRPPIWIAFAPLLNTWLTEGVPEENEEHPAAPRTVQQEHDVAAPVSKTYDLLLDVDLPVSVSFGRTQLALKEVLKLTTGSIVELNRAVSEPVEVIVNNCVIARGEVVVVGGNYGVRIHQIVSRQERLRTGSSPGAALRAPKAAISSGPQATT